MRSFFAFSIVTLAMSLAHGQQIKNEQTLLNGYLTRAGNTQQKELSDTELKSLCERGYASAFFLYGGAHARVVTCTNGQISYRSQSINSPLPILEALQNNIQAGTKTFVHCNNGAHASGYIAALALRQFCSVDARNAFSYWSANIAGYALQPANVAGIQKRIETFSASLSLQLSAEDKVKIGCANTQ